MSVKLCQRPCYVYLVQVLVELGHGTVWDLLHSPFCTVVSVGVVQVGVSLLRVAYSLGCPDYSEFSSLQGVCLRTHSSGGMLLLVCWLVSPSGGKGRVSDPHLSVALLTVSMSRYFRQPPDCPLRLALTCNSPSKWSDWCSGPDICPIFQLACGLPGVLAVLVIAQGFFIILLMSCYLTAIQ